jgi:hypothetical protein
MSEPFSKKDIERELYNAVEPDINKLSLVIRKPQEGKTFICINKITRDISRNIHIVLTMNTLASGMQFFGRMEKDVGSERIIVFNSKKSTAGECHHAADVADILRIIRENQDIKVIVCCAHELRIRKSIPSLLELAHDAISFKEYNRKFVIHVDEAHVYIPENRKHIRKYNAASIVASIIGYSGTPNEIWEIKKSDPLFNNIPVEDVDQELNMIRSPHYYGVKDCEHHKIYDELLSRHEILERAKLSHQIPTWIVNETNMKKKKQKETWYGEKYCFDLGNELLHLSVIKIILPLLNIPQTGFSYHYIPAYTRIATHYYTVSIITRLFPEANVIVINGNGMVCWRRDKEGKLDGSRNGAVIVPKNEKEREQLLEPSYMIQRLIQGVADYPTFVTGYKSVGMSVTLINEILGNFDNVIFTHTQLIKKDKDYSADIYQLCRFLFNYTSWSAEGRARIKKTKLYCLTKDILDKCLGYEEHVELLSTDYAGKNCSLREVLGLGELEQSEREKKKDELLSVGPSATQKLWMKRKVYDGNDDEEWQRVKTFYRQITGTELKGRSMPKMKNGFYECSATKKSEEEGKKFIYVHTRSEIEDMKEQSWWSTFALTKKKLSYARVFVGYENKDDPSEYTIFVKHVQLENTKKVHAILEKYGKQKTDGDTSSVVSAEPEENSEEESVIVRGHIQTRRPSEE